MKDIIKIDVVSFNENEIILANADLINDLLETLESNDSVIFRWPGTTQPGKTHNESILIFSSNIISKIKNGDIIVKGSERK